MAAPMMPASLPMTAGTTAPSGTTTLFRALSQHPQVLRPTLEDVYLGLIADDAAPGTAAPAPALVTTEAAR